MRKYGQRTHHGVRAMIHDLASKAVDAGQPPDVGGIRAALLRDLERKGRDTHDFREADIPTARTIFNILRTRARDASGPWTPTNTEPGIEPVLVLPVLAQVVEASEGKRRYLTVAEARLLTTIRSASSDIPVNLAMAVARAYIAGTESDDLDTFLAFAPWHDDDARNRYEAATRAGWVQPPGVWRRQRQMDAAVETTNTRRDAMRGQRERAAEARHAQAATKVVNLQTGEVKATTARGTRAQKKGGR